MKDRKKIIVRSILIGTLLTIVLFSILGEKIPMFEGAPWDGMFYREVARSFSDDIVKGAYDSYRVQRIAPFAFINLIFSLLNINKSDGYLLIGMNILNFLTLISGIYCYLKISSLLKLSLITEIIGFSSLFFSFPILKLTGYYPYSTDLYGFVFSIIQFLFFLKNRRMLLLLVSIIGAFTFPTVWITGIILLFLPSEGIILNDNLEFDKVNKILNNLLKILPSVIFLVYFAYLYFRFYFTDRDFKTNYIGPVYSNLLLLSISVICVAVYLYLYLYPVRIKIKDTIFKLYNSLKTFRIIMAILLVLLMNVFINYLSNDSDAFGFDDLIRGTLIRPTTDPFVFLINHFMYYGLFIIILLILWDKFWNKVGEFGFSYFFIILLCMPLTLGSESRIMITFVPYFLIPILICLNEIKINYKSIIFYITANLILSRFWYKINVPGIKEAFSLNHETYINFPAQRLFLNFGPWQRHEIYYLFLVLFIIALIIFLKSSKKIHWGESI